MTNVQYFEQNTVGRDFVVGDLHGCREDFDRFLHQLNFDADTDRVFSVGDLVDRGPDSVGAFELVYEPWFHAVRGNHEQMMIDATTSQYGWDASSNWVMNGGQWHYDVDTQLMKEFGKKADELPYIIVIGKDSPERINIVHAELYGVKDSDIDAWNFRNNQTDAFIWGRTIAGMIQAWRHLGNPELSTTFVGHTPMTKAQTCLRHIFIDLGACYNHLSGNDTNLCIFELGYGKVPNKQFVYNMNTKTHKQVYA